MILLFGSRIEPCQDKYRIRLLLRKRPHDKTGARRVSTSSYCTAIDAEDDAFNFRYSLESKKAKERLEDYKTNLELLLSGTMDSSNPIPEVIESSTLDQAPAKRQRQLSGKKQKSFGMSASYYLNNRTNAKHSKNPMNSPPNHTSAIASDEVAVIYAMKIQKWIKHRDAVRAAKSWKATFADQNYRLSLLRYLTKHIVNEDPASLLLGAEDAEVASTYSAYDCKRVLLKARHVADAIRIMYEKTETRTPITWLACCEQACANSYYQIKRGRTVADWYLELHQTTTLKFRRCERGRQSFQAKSPFSDSEDLSVQLKSWARADIEHLTIQKAAKFVNEELLADWTADQFRSNRIQYPVSEHIVSRWMREVGFSYEAHKKSYYVDRHEDDDVVADRHIYINEDLEDELYEHCWIQLPKKQYLNFKFKGRIESIRVKKENEVSDIAKQVSDFLDKKFTYFYCDDDGKEWAEVHTDVLYNYGDNDNNLPVLGKFGGNVSVRLKEGMKARLVFGQDEAIFRSSQLNECCWMVDGKTTLQTKGLGKGIMVSALVSRAFGFGFNTTREQLSEINVRREGKSYADVDAATYLLGSPQKKPLDKSPFIRCLDYGAGKDGYWTYKHMVLQIEDCVDCLTYLYPDLDYVFELDHSSGHACERPDGLTVVSQQLNWNWGGKQRLMRDSVLNKDCIGEVRHERAADVDKTYSHVFLDNDLPPILDPQAPKYDGDVVLRYKENVPMTVPELRKQLEENGLSSDGKKDDLLKRCDLGNLPSRHRVAIKKEGYVGKAKGAAHIGFERGFWDENLRLPDGRLVSMQGSKATVEGTKEIRNPSTSAREILRSCQDIRSEKPHLKYIVEDLLGCVMKLTPKCHPEIAGRGVEYAWGYSKLRFRKHFNDAVPRHLEENVKKALSTDILTLNRMRKFARKARDYKLTYAFLIDRAGGNDATAAKDEIEHITKMFKAHRSAMDADYSFIVNS
jgi:hypothetical protein